MLGEVTQQISDTIKAKLEGVHTAVPGTIVSLDTEKCTATVKPAMLFKKPDGTKISYPEISGVPVVIPQSAGQKVTIAYPIKPGDGCLIIAAEQSIDLWRYEQETSTDLRFDLTNSICIPGLFNKPNAALARACKTGALVIEAENIQITGNVTINGDLTTSGGIVRLN